MPLPNANGLVRPLVLRLAPYIPGEQPKIDGLIKLNTNENPYPPSPKVLAAIKAAVDDRLRLYPNPTAETLRLKLAKLHGCRPENIIVGNGSDELLALAVRAFVDPRFGQIRELFRSIVQYFHPSYSLYPVLAEAHGAAINQVSLPPDFSLPSLARLRRERQWDYRAALTFITTPNAPSGRGYSCEHLSQLCAIQRGVVILDEAYVDFGAEHCLELALKYPHVLVSRTFSKAYSLCFQRVGYFVGNPELIAALNRIRDSYNVNGLGQIAACATLDDLPYYQRNFKKIIETREAVSAALADLGFEVLPSQTNFIFVHPPRYPAQQWLEKLRRRKILVRWFNHSFLGDHLRITIGTPEEMDALVHACRRLLK